MELENNSKWIYKYTPFNLNAIKIFVNNQLWFGKPDIQNDPNEVEFILEYGDEYKKDYSFKFLLSDELKKVIKETNSGEKLVNGFEKREFENCLKKSIRDHIGICSLSNKCDDILMWSHYADSNKGICIVFKREELVKNMSVDISDNVTYSENMPHAKFVNNDEIGCLYFDKVIFNHKFQNWEDESEFRFVRLYNTLTPQKYLRRLEKFPTHCIEGVIIGERFSEKDFETLTNLLLRRKDYKEIKFWQCTKNIYERKMRVYPISDSRRGKMDIIFKSAKEEMYRMS